MCLLRYFEILMFNYVRGIVGEMGHFSTEFLLEGVVGSSFVEHQSCSPLAQVDLTIIFYMYAVVCE